MSRRTCVSMPLSWLEYKNTSPIKLSMHRWAVLSPRLMLGKGASNSTIGRYASSVVEHPCYVMLASGVDELAR